jgi:hypothetical protein
LLAKVPRIAGSGVEDRWLAQEMLCAQAAAELALGLDG